jgi:polar amino acid transport system permease protein
METTLQQFFNLRVMEQAFPLILGGLKQTVIICLIVVPLGLVGGLVSALISLSRLRAVRWTAIAAIDFFRSIPPLVLLIFVYAGLPFAGFRLSPLAAVAISFFLNTSSYYGEIYRAGIESVGLGQWDAARSTGLRSYHTLAYRAAAGDAKRPSRSHIEYSRGGETYLNCERGGATGAALFC